MLILQRNGKQGVSDLDGKKIIQLEYDNIIITGNSYLCGFIMKEGKKDDIKRS